MKKITYMLAGVLLVALVLPVHAEKKKEKKGEVSNPAMLSVCQWAAGRNISANEGVISTCAELGVKLGSKPAGAGSLSGGESNTNVNDVSEDEVNSSGVSASVGIAYSVDAFWKNVEAFRALKAACGGYSSYDCIINTLTTDSAAAQGYGFSKDSIEFFKDLCTNYDGKYCLNAGNSYAVHFELEENHIGIHFLSPSNFGLDDKEDSIVGSIQYGNDGSVLSGSIRPLSSGGQADCEKLAKDLGITCNPVQQ